MKYSDTYIIRMHDFDAKFKIKPTGVDILMQETADHQMRDMSPTYEEVYNLGYYFVMSKMSFELIKEINKYDEITCTTWLTENKRGYVFTRSYELRRGEELVAKGLSNWALVNRKTKKLVKCNEINFSEFFGGEPLEGICLKQKRMKKEELSFIDTHKVVYFDTDMNGHMTNTIYLNMYSNYIPNIEKKYVIGFNIHYINEVPYNDEIDVYVSEPNIIDGGEEEYVIHGYRKSDGKQASSCVVKVKNI